MARGRFTMHRCAVPGIEAVEAASRHSFARHTHDRFGIGVIERGAQRSLSGRGPVEAGSGDVITVNPGEVHDGAPIGDAGRSWRIVYLDPALVAEAAADITDGRRRAYEFMSPVVADPRAGRRVCGLFDALTDDREPDAGGRWEALLLTLLVGLGTGTGTGRGSTVPDAIAPAREMIDDDPAASLALADLARACGLSRYQLIRAFAKATGMTPHAYLVQRRIDRARALIADGVSLAEAAAGSGFADQSHMTRVFVGKYGLSPGVYADALR